MASFIRTSDHLTIVFDDGVTATVYQDPLNPTKFADIARALAAKDYTRARMLALPAEQVKTQIRDTFGVKEDLVTVEHGIVRYEGKEIHNTLTQRMIQMLEEGFDITPLKLFMINLQQNPSYRAVNELYRFLERGNLPITEDGYFLAYKKVRADYRDVHSGKFDNSVGKVVEMPRNQVDEDSRNECSNGLHFCSKEYLTEFGGERTVIVKINPADVVAIPTDYNSSKGRTCRYEVIGELGTDGSKLVNAGGTLEGAYRNTAPVVEVVPLEPIDSDDWFDNEDEDEDEDWLDDEEDKARYSDFLKPFSDEDFERAMERAERAVDGVAVVESNLIDSLNSSFVGIPGDGEPLVVPREIALEIAQSLEDDEEDLEPVIAIKRNPDELLEFDDISKAAEHANVRVSDIRRVLRGERKTTGGYEWIGSNS